MATLPKPMFWERNRRSEAKREMLLVNNPAVLRARELNNFGNTKNSQKVLVYGINQKHPVAEKPLQLS